MVYPSLQNVTTGMPKSGIYLFNYCLYLKMGFVSLEDAPQLSRVSVATPYRSLHNYSSSSILSIIYMRNN